MKNLQMLHDELLQLQKNQSKFYSDTIKTCTDISRINLTPSTSLLTFETFIDKVSANEKAYNRSFDLLDTSFHRIAAYKKMINFVNNKTGINILLIERDVLNNMVNRLKDIHRYIQNEAGATVFTFEEIQSIFSDTQKTYTYSQHFTDVESIETMLSSKIENLEGHIVSVNAQIRMLNQTTILTPEDIKYFDELLQIGISNSRF